MSFFLSLEASEAHSAPGYDTSHSSESSDSGDSCQLYGSGGLDDEFDEKEQNPRRKRLRPRKRALYWYPFDNLASSSQDDENNDDDDDVHLFDEED